MPHLFLYIESEQPKNNRVPTRKQPFLGYNHENSTIYMGKTTQKQQKNNQNGLFC